MGDFLAVAQHLEEPPYHGERFAIATVALCNMAWLIPWTIRKRRNCTMVLLGVAVFCLCWLPFLVGHMYNPAFNADKWKSSLDEGYSYGTESQKYPAHRSGYMIPDLIESGVCIGKTEVEIEGLLGKDHFHEIGLCDSCFAYYYSGGGLFDGCNKLALRFEHGRCTSVGFWGCD